MDLVSLYAIEGSRPSEIKSKQLGKIAVNIVENIILSELGWLFAHNTLENDYGVDAYIERREVINDKIGILGEVIALQIKSSNSYNEESIINFEFGESHKNYWSNHTLPIIIVMVDRSNRECYWKLFEKESIKEVPDVEGKYYIEVPKFKKLDEGSKHELTIIANTGKYRKLSIYLSQLELMEIAQDTQYNLKAVFSEHSEFHRKYLGKFVDLDAETNVGRSETKMLETAHIIIPFINDDFEYDVKLDPRIALEKYFDWAEIEDLGNDSYYIKLKEEYNVLVNALKVIKGQKSLFSK
jgi:hypothetical protein